MHFKVHAIMALATVAIVFSSAEPTFAQTTDRQRRDFTAADIAEYREVCKAKRITNYGNFGPKLGETFNVARIDYYDEKRFVGLEEYTTTRDPAGASFIEVFYHLRRLDVDTLAGMSTPEANFNRGWGSLGEHLVCAGQVRVTQLLRRAGAKSPSAAPSRDAAPGRSFAPPSAQAVPMASSATTAPAGVYGEGAFGPRTKAALDALLAPGVPKAKPNAPTLDYFAVEHGGPVSQQSKLDNVKAQQDFDKTKTRKLHNRENDATDCIKVEPTGVREEWGMEGKFRLRNICSYPVEASWCANAAECTTGRGNTWKIPASKTWPIFFADPASPYVGVGACRTGADAKPLPSDAAIAAAGGVNVSHKPPAPAPGVQTMPNHRCE